MATQKNSVTFDHRASQFYYIYIETSRDENNASLKTFTMSKLFNESIINKKFALIKYT
jgi:hypothetical protein